MSQGVVQSIGPADDAMGTVTLDYDARFRRRIVLTSDQGMPFMLDLPTATELKEGDGLILDTGQVLRVVAALEDVMEVRATSPHHLMRTAWHIGNRHLPCEIHGDRLVLRWDHVIAEMLEQLGCTVARVKKPFQPEGGAYGHGRTHGHDHGHSHGHNHGHSH